jgi:hypothetical protein
MPMLAANILYSEQNTEMRPMPRFPEFLAVQYSILWHYILQNKHQIFKGTVSWDRLKNVDKNLQN